MLDMKVRRIVDMLSNMSLDMLPDAFLDMSLDMLDMLVRHVGHAC